MKNKHWRNQRDLIRAGKRKLRKLRRSQVSLRVVEPEAVEEKPEEQQDSQPRTNRMLDIKGIAGRKQKRRYELQKKI
jgi:hypothetical protein